MKRDFETIMHKDQKIYTTCMYVYTNNTYIYFIFLILIVIDNRNFTNYVNDPSN